VEGEVVSGLTAVTRSELRITVETELWDCGMQTTQPPELYAAWGPLPGGPESSECRFCSCSISLASCRMIYCWIGTKRTNISGQSARVSPDRAISVLYLLLTLWYNLGTPVTDKLGTAWGVSGNLCRSQATKFVGASSSSWYTGKLQAWKQLWSWQLTLDWSCPQPMYGTSLNSRNYKRPWLWLRFNLTLVRMAIIKTIHSKNASEDVGEKEPFLSTMLLGE
jgi:hypothetical protein